MTVFKEILGNITDIENVESYQIENIHLTSDDVLKRVIIISSDQNVEYGIRLEEDKKLRDGDILYKDDYKLVVIRLELSDVLIITARTIGEMAQIAHNLGNRHMPAQFTETQMIVPYDYLVEQYLQDNKALYEREKIKLKEAFRHCSDAK
ncbi:urease accessory protein UreE [Ureaplasma urealyticum]|uniref:Urease accessory protein UreE n=4 Tax=Ureaplasma urealyticum TaxID=2130 RepID=UREE_UREU1|nr:urease accessory protein UreE [Ureaplasma urealyticum]B5ZBS8.1 RecName: Full=Urease accessory protein UreE [Ureaplasma urealyticum serovar 10 str. ATCC 33699]P0CB04.1 RecName: Full=Urease accessory protein UreE [Ureaplasma urealyticum]AAG10328.1 urease complex component UreE [Ureaplasma urealyticum serovar 9 str. ATCC 33175]AAG10303.1 urease complex component UreE [Ureaplasma urealyticum serovar 2 str. ATCC 27814]AAG10308.1 urease complex component UreE [Ureaplasma urealyticum serovar 4 str